MALEINGEILDDDLINEELDHFKKKHAPDLTEKTLTQKELLKKVKNHLIKKTLLFQEAKKSHTHFSKQEIENFYKKKMQSYQNENDFYTLYGLSFYQKQKVKQHLELNMKVESLLENYCKDIQPITKEHLKMFYEDNLSSYLSPESFTLAILATQDSPKLKKKIDFIQKETNLIKKKSAFINLIKTTPPLTEDYLLKEIPKKEMLKNNQFQLIHFEEGEIATKETTYQKKTFAMIIKKHARILLSFEKTKQKVYQDLIEELRILKVQAYLNQLEKNATIIDDGTNTNLFSFS